MRNEKLKNDLNNIPQDFDREALWNNISLPQKRRKNRMLLWFLFFGISLSGFLFFVLQNEGIQDDKNLVSIESTSDKVGSTNDKIESTIDQKDKLKSPTNLDLSSQKVEPSPIREQNDQKLRNDNVLDQEKRGKIKVNDSDSKSYSQSFIGQNSQNDSEKTAKVKLLDSEKTALDKSNISNEQETESTSHNTPSESVFFNIPVRKDRITDQTSENVIPTRKIMLVSNITSLSIKELATSNHKVTYDGIIEVNQVEAVQNPVKSNFSISATSFVGRSNHEFNGNGGSELRSLSEEALESVGLSLFGHFNIKKMDFFSGVSYQRYNTHVQNNSNEFVVINSIQGLAEKNISTQYSLYNSYQHFDLIAGFGYRLNINQKWSLKPSAQVGYTFNYKYDGEIFNSENELVKLSELEGYKDYSKWQGQINLSITRKISEQWSLGLLTYYNTQKSLGIFEEYTHSVASFGMGLALYRNFN